MIAFFNNAVVIALSGLIADFIRKRYQEHKQIQAKQDEQHRQLQQKQDELLDDLSHLTSTVVGETSMLVMGLSNCITGGKIDLEILESLTETWYASITELSNSNAAYYFKIQKLTPKPHSAANLFRGSDFSEEILIVGKQVKIEENTSFVCAVWILSKMIWHALPSYEIKLQEIQNILNKKGDPGLIDATIQALDNIEDNVKAESQCHAVEKIKRIVLDRDNERTDLEDWLFDKDTKPLSRCYSDLLADTKEPSNESSTDDDERLVQNVLWLLDKYKEMYGLLTQVDKKLQQFFPILNKEFEEKDRQINEVR